MPERKEGPSIEKESQEIVEDKTFLAGNRRTLWRVQLIKNERGDVAVRLMRVGRRLVVIVFPVLELPDVIKHLSTIKIKLGGS